MKLSNNISKRSIFYLFCAMLISLAFGSYCQTKFTPVENLIPIESSTTLEAQKNIFIRAKVFLNHSNDSSKNDTPLLFEVFYYQYNMKSIPYYF